MSGGVERVIVVGGGLAGLRSVQSLREQGYVGRLALLGAEPHSPYDRPPLSKEFLSGDVDDPTLPADWAELDVERLLGRHATGVRPGVVDTDSGELAFDGLVIATGATPIRLPGEGRQRTLRTVDDARSLRAALRPGLHLAIVGAGWIGAEVATAAARARCRVTVVEAGPAPLGGGIGAIMGAYTRRWYEESAIDLRLNTAVEAAVDGGLALAGGEFLPADEVLTAVGVRPETRWLAGSGLATDAATGGAVAVDEWLRASLPGVCAVGDCAAWWSRRFGARLRVEHWDNALRAPSVATATLLNGRPGSGGGEAPEPYDPVPYFWSAQHGRMLQYAGHHEGADGVVWRGDPGDEGWGVCWTRGGALVAILGVDRHRDVTQGRRLIGSGKPLDLERLADPDVPVKKAVIASAA